MPLRLPLLLACFLATVLEVSCDRESLTSQLENVRAMLKRAEKNTGAAAERAVEKLRKEETVLSGNLRDWIDWEHSSGFAEEAGRQDEGLMRGRKFSCGICQVIASMTESLVKQRESEEDIVALFEETCDNLPENMIQQDMMRSDAVRLCQQVIKTHAEDIIDACSTGEGINLICKELGVCDETHEETMNMVEAVGKAREEEARAKEIEGNSGPVDEL